MTNEDYKRIDEKYKNKFGPDFNVFTVPRNINIKSPLMNGVVVRATYLHNGEFIETQFNYVPGREDWQSVYDGLEKMFAKFENECEQLRGTKGTPAEELVKQLEAAMLDISKAIKYIKDGA